MQLNDHSVFVEFIFKKIQIFLFFFYDLEDMQTQMIFTNNKSNTSWTLPQT